MKVILSILFLFSLQCIACEFESHPSLAIATSLKKQKTFFFNEQQSEYDKEFIRAYNCTKLALSNKFLMLANGPEIIEFDDSIKSFSFTDKLRESKKCSIENPPVPLMSFKDKEIVFKSKKKYFNTCVETFIEDEGTMPINIKLDQPGCSVKKLSSHRAIVQGGFCFVKPNFTSTFLIKTRIKKECKSYEGLMKLGVQPQDLKGNINFYASGDDSGSSIQLEALSSTPIRIITNSEKKFMPSSDDYGLDYPSFPTNWVDVDPYIGMPELNDRGDYYQLKPKFFVDNRCSRECAEGICMGECDFATPVTANISLKAYSSTKRRYEYLTSWIDGGVAQPSFQGMINGIGFDIPKHYLNETDKYRLEFSFDDPKFDFERFKNNIKRKFGRMEQQLPRLGRSDISNIPDINQIREQGLLPMIRSIHGLNFDQELNGLQAALDTLRQYLDYKIWPPYFGRLCDKARSDCQDIQTEYIKIVLDFNLVKTDRGFELTNIKVTKRDIFKNRNYINNKLPIYKCSFENGAIK